LIPLGARISPEFLVEIGAEIRDVEGPRKRGMLGLLFGRTERNVVSLEAFLAVTADCAADAGSGDSERLKRALDEMLPKWRLRPGLASLELVGWCCAQPSDDFGETPQGCIDFHIRRFRRASDVLLIVRSGDGRQLSGQVYARLSDSPLSPEHYASGRIAVDLNRRARGPVYVSISGPAESAHSELYFRTYESARALEKAERKEARFGAFKKALDWQAPAWLSTGGRSDAVVAPGASAAMAPIAKPAAPEMAVVRPFAEEQGQRLHRSRRLPWIVSAGVLLTVSGIAIAYLNSRSDGARPRAAVLAPAPENASLGLRIHVQGDDFLITWDREAPAIESAAKGVLRIQDGSERRITELQPAELANGSIIYRPSSDDIDFLLSVYARDGSVTKESVRALDGTRSSRADVTDHAPQLVETASGQRSSEPKSSAVAMEARSRGPVSRGEAVPEGGMTADYIGPQPLKVVMPDVAQLAPESLPKGRIEIEVEIDAQGRVTAARLPAGGPRVSAEAARAAIAAAKQWRFEPAKLHGKSIASKHHVFFDIHSGTP
jgi:TonB family protein